MVIDVILDRKDDEKEGHFDGYSPKDFYDAMMDYADMGGEDIASAMDGGTEEDVKAAICRYIEDYGYNPDICKWVKSVSWLGENESCKQNKEACTKKEGCKSSMQKKKESFKKAESVDSNASNMLSDLQDIINTYCLHGNKKVKLELVEGPGQDYVTATYGNKDTPDFKVPVGGTSNAYILRDVYKKIIEYYF